MTDPRPKKHLPPAVFREKHMSWTWGGGIAGALPAALLIAGAQDPGIGMMLTGLLLVGAGLLAGSLIFESAHTTSDD